MHVGMHNRVGHCRRSWVGPRSGAGTPIATTAIGDRSSNAARDWRAGVKVASVTLEKAVSASASSQPRHNAMDEMVVVMMEQSVSQQSPCARSCSQLTSATSMTVTTMMMEQSSHRIDGGSDHGGWPTKATRVAATTSALTTAESGEVTTEMMSQKSAVTATATTRAATNITTAAGVDSSGNMTTANLTTANVTTAATTATMSPRQLAVVVAVIVPQPVGLVITNPPAAIRAAEEIGVKVVYPCVKTLCFRDGCSSNQAREERTHCHRET